MKCSICDKEVDDDVKICPKCRHDFSFNHKENPTHFHENYSSWAFEDEWGCINRRELGEYYMTHEPKVNRSGNALGFIIMFLIVLGFTVVGFIKLLKHLLNNQGTLVLFLIICAFVITFLIGLGIFVFINVKKHKKDVKE